MRRIIYFFYYLKELDREKLSRFLKFASKESGIPRSLILFDLLYSVFKFSISLLDYFYFRFYEKNFIQRAEWAGTGFMYEYQLKMNPPKSRKLLENKIVFLTHFRNNFNRKFIFFNNSKINEKELSELLDSKTGKLVLKNSMGQVGAEVEVIKCNDYTVNSLISYMYSKSYDLIEEYVYQHPALMNLSSSGLNTIRIFTQLHNNKVELLGARLRISVNSSVDNMGAGNLAACVDIESGKVNGVGVYSDITKQDATYHPVTGVKIIGFQVPHWEKTIEMISNVALYAGGNLSVGWDIGITENGPELIEGNHNWCKLLWQLPMKQGLKPMLEKYLN